MNRKITFFFLLGYLTTSVFLITTPGIITPGTVACPSTTTSKIRFPDIVICGFTTPEAKVTIIINGSPKITTANKETGYFIKELYSARKGKNTVQIYAEKNSIRSDEYPVSVNFLPGVTPTVTFSDIILKIPEIVSKTTISLEPEEDNFVINQQVSISVNVNANRPINAVEGTINFPIDNLGVASLSTEGSILTLWVQEPSFSNESGLIEFAGAILPGGFQGQGKILTIVFEPKKLGPAKLSFSAASVLAHDSKGTDILEEMVGAIYSIKDKEPSDFNNDGQVNLTDISIFIYHIKSTDNPQFDLNQDGEINLVDLSILVSKVNK